MTKKILTVIAGAFIAGFCGILLAIVLIVLTWSIMASLDGLTANDTVPFSIFLLLIPTSFNGL